MIFATRLVFKPRGGKTPPLCTHRGSGSDLPFRLTANSAGDGGVSNHQSAYFGKDFYKRVFQDEHIGHTLRPWEKLISEAYL